MPRSPQLPALRRVAALAAALLALVGCQHQAPAVASAAADGAPWQAEARKTMRNASMDAWKDEIIYFALTDRFSDGDASNNFDVNKSDPNAYHGGDFQGLINQLDYIQGLGATALWVTPIVAQKPDALVGKYWAFHGYWAWDFTQVDRHLGSEAKFKELVDKAHQRGMKVLLDMVVNHAGYDAPLAKDPAHANWFHHNGNIVDWNNQSQVENNDIFGLPDFNTENPQVLQSMEQTYASWIQRTGVDGFRMDTVKHVPIGFWQAFNASIHQHAPANFLLLGEVLNGDPNYLAPYSRAGFDSLFDFPLYYTFDQVFAQGQSIRQLGQRLAQDGSYQDATMLSPFLDNHDMPRFMSRCGGDERKLRLAMACLYTLRGIPMNYMGTEVGMKGAGEPDNRADMAFGSNPALTSYTAQLMHLRGRLPALRRGRLLETWQDDQVYGYSRLVPGGDEALVFLNNSNTAQTRSVPLRAESTLADGATLANQLGSGDRVAIAGRHVTLTLAPYEAKVYALPTAGLSRPGRSRTKPRRD